MGFTPCKAELPHGMELREKEKELEESKKAVEKKKPKDKRYLLTLDLKPFINIIVQRKALCRIKIPDSTCAREKIVGMGILITSRNGDKKSRNLLE